MTDLPDEAVEAAFGAFLDSFCDDEAGRIEPVSALDGTTGYAMTGGNDARAVFAKALTVAAPHIAAQDTKDVRAERDSILRRIERLPDEAVEAGIDAIFGPSKWLNADQNDAERSKLYPDVRAILTAAAPLIAAQATADLCAELTDLRASRDEWASRMMEFAETQRAPADLRAGIEALRDTLDSMAEIDRDRHDQDRASVISEIIAALDALIGGAK